MLFPHNNQALSVGLGQYTYARAIFTSDDLLPGKVLRIWPSLYTPGVVPRSPAFQILYPASAGMYDMTNLGCKNYKARLKIIDAQTFEVYYYFFATRNFNGYFPISQFQNSQALSFTGTQTYDLTIAAQVEDDQAFGIVPITVSQSCVGVQFIESGFTPGVDLPVQIQIDAPVGNNFYCALVNEGAVNNSTDIVNGLISSYVKVGALPQSVDDLPNGCLSAGMGFMQSGDTSLANITVSGACLQNGGNYRLLVIYQKGGQWTSCISDVISQAATSAPILPSATYVSTDGFGSEAGQCISKVANVSPLTLCVEIDTAEYLTLLEDNNLAGDWDDYFAGVRAFVASGSDAIGGRGVQVVENSSSSFCVENFTHNGTGTIFVIFMVEMRYPTHSDFIRYPFKITYDAPEIDIIVPVTSGGNEVTSLCDGISYEIEFDQGDCIVYESINGSNYGPVTILEGTAIDEEAIPVNGVVCFKVVCPGDVAEECDCSDCGTVNIEVTQVQFADTGSASIRFCASGMASGIVEYDFSTFGGSGGSDTAAFSSGCTSYIATDVYNPGDPSLPAYVSQVNITRIELVAENGCIYEIFPGISIATTTSPPASDQISTYTIEATYSGCDCDEAPTVLECNNTASLNYTCDEDTGEVTLEVVENFDSPTDGDPVFEASYDGGVTFISAPSTISGQSSIFVRYRAIFSDGCPPVSFEQSIECLPIQEFTNTREVEMEVVGDELVITITDSFTSTELTDTLDVSIDGGVTFKRFDPTSSYIPIALTGGENIVAEWNIIFDDGTPDLHGIKTLKNISQTDPADCAGYDDYTLAVEYDENTGIFTVTKTGNETVLLANELLWTLGAVAGNPFDTNNSGIPYTDPVRGEGMFVIAWRIKLADCQEKTMYATTFGKECIKFCDPIEITVPDTVSVILPETPIEVCLVECCASFVPEIECVDHVLSVTNAPEGATISWVGPGGYNYSGNDAPVEDDGTYTVTVVDDTATPPCTSTASYTFNHANAGEPISNPIDVS